LPLEIALRKSFQPGRLRWRLWSGLTGWHPRLRQPEPEPWRIRKSRSTALAKKVVNKVEWFALRAVFKVFLHQGCQLFLGATILDRWRCSWLDTFIKLRNKYYKHTIAYLLCCYSVGVVANDRRFMIIGSRVGLKLTRRSQVRIPPGCKVF
jgi:hypothetical protein